MKFDEYLKMLMDHYPEKHFDIIISLGWTKVELVKKVAELLFIEGIIDSDLAIETRKQLVSLSKNGIHCFK